MVENQPFVGLRPTILLWPAGTRPDPAVSVPKLKGTIPLATTTDEPELEPPLIYSGLKLFYCTIGERTPTSPVAN